MYLDLFASDNRHNQAALLHGSIIMKLMESGRRLSSKEIMVIALTLLIPLFLNAQRGKPQNKIPGDFCLSSDEIHLYRLINEYRAFSGLEIIPLSKSLSYVAHVHVRDLEANRPDLHSCNLHSWSDKGNWTACCYSKDPNRTNCMWNKPRELTTYMGNGQELILWENIPASARSAFDQWRNFEPTNDMLLNRDRWSDRTWKGVGIAIYQGYASVWFGEVTDHEKSVLLCENNAELAADWLIKETQPSGEEPVPEPEQVIKQVTYYLIVGSFKERSQAETEVSRLKSGGYTDARMVQKNGNFRISVYDFADLEQAKQMRRQLDAVFKGIWIMEN